MKKFLFIIPMLLLAWCWTEFQTATDNVSDVEFKDEAVQEVQKEETKSELETVYMWDEKAQFYMETENWTVFLIPWIVKEETTLKSNNQFQEDAVAGEYSKFLVVWFVIDNQSKDPITFFSSDIPEVYDSKDRRYKPASEYTSDFYLPTAIAVLESKPWIPVQWYVVYEVSKDSEWFYMIAWDWKRKILLQEKSE